MLMFLLYIAKFLTSVLLIIIIWLIFAGYFPSWRRYRLAQKLPGPKGVFLFGNIFDLAKVPLEDALTWITFHFQNYDRLMKMWYMVITNVFIKDPEDIQELFNSTRHIGKGLIYKLIQPWLGQGLLTSAGEKWHSRRKLLTPAFHFKILEENMPVFNKYSNILCQKFKDSNGKEVDIESFLNLCTLDVIMTTAMGKSINAQIEGGQKYVSELKSVTSLITKRMFRPHLYTDLMFNISITGRKFWNSVSFLHDFSHKVIKERKVSINIPTDSKKKSYMAFLDKMLELEANHPGSLSDQDMREEVDTFMFEGHDTTSVALVYIFFNLAQHMDIQNKVFEELQGIFAESNRDVCVNDLNKMIYLEKVIKESLRLYPSVPVVTRLLDKDLVLNGGIILPANCNVVTPIYIVHRNPKYWEDPETFDPNRFNEDQIQKRHPYAYLPFSAGARNCIGQRFVMMEMKTVVATVIRKLRILPITQKEDIKFILSLVLRTNKPILCKFVLR